MSNVVLVTSASGVGYFNRLGSFIGEFNRVAALYGSATDVGFQSIWSLFGSSDQAAVQSLPDAVAAFRQTGTGYQSVLVADGQLASQLQAYNANPLVPNTYSQSVTNVRNQMVDTSQSINRPTISTLVTADGGNLGNTTFSVSNTNIYGDPLDMTLTENFTATCQSQGSGFGASFSVVGQPVIAAGAWNWPGGSGAIVSVTVVDPANDGIITNGDFGTFTVPNIPDNWTIVNGAAGTTVFKSTSGGVRTGTDAVYLQSDGSSATQLAQAVTLSINTVYAVTFQAKMNSASVSGTFIVQLVNGATSAVLADDAGSNLSYTRNLNGQITTSYQLFTVFFSTPRQLPASVELRIGYSVAGVSTRQLFLDLVQVFQPTPLYGAAGTGTSGPWVAAVGNTTYNGIGDFYTLAFTNSLTSQSIALGSQRVYGLRELGLYWPSTTSPTVPDNLVTH